MNQTVIYQELPIKKLFLKELGVDANKNENNYYLDKR